jgi:FkbM family methyltransferase
LRLVNVYTHSFFEELIGPHGTVLDLGANVGKFATLITERYPCRCVAVEPAPNEFRQIPSDARIQAHNLAVCGQPGEVVLNLTANSECNSLGKVPGHNYTDSVRVRAVTLDDALKLVSADQVSLLKLDIEGSEIDVLGTADPAVLRRFDQITVEFHDCYDMTPEPVVRDTIRKVRDAGFHVLCFYRGPRRHIDVLFVNRLRMGTLRYAVEIARHWAPRIVRAAWRRITGTVSSEEWFYSGAASDK